MIDLDALWSKWSAPFADETLIDSLNAHEARQTMRDMLGDIHDLVKVVTAVREYGKARVAQSEAFEAWVDQLGAVGAERHERNLQASLRLDETRDGCRIALDRVDAIAVQLAGGDVSKVCEGQVQP